MGFITCSEGCNDDVNKIVWSALGWDPNSDVAGILAQYRRYFIGPEFEAAFAKGLLALERNWRGPLALNQGVEETLGLFQKLERQAAPQQLLNWRFQQVLYRAYYDAYTRGRLLHERDRERRAIDMLCQAPGRTSIRAVEPAESILASAEKPVNLAEWRVRIYQLAEVWLLRR